MAFKFVAFAVLIAAANAGVLPAAPVYPAVQAYSAPAYAAHAYAAPAAVVHAQPAALIQQRYVQPAPVVQQIATPVYAKQAEEYDPNPQYSYSYDIHDSLTGDAKNQQETRSGDVVQGSYSLIDADGFRRTVEYTADPVHGFNAVVNREPLTKAVAVAPVAAKVIAPAPILAAKTILPAQPIAYAQPQYLQTPYLTKAAYVH